MHVSCIEMTLPCALVKVHFHVVMRSNRTTALGTNQPVRTVSTRPRLIKNPGTGIYVALSYREKTEKVCSVGDGNLYNMF